VFPKDILVFVSILSYLIIVPPYGGLHNLSYMELHMPMRVSKTVVYV